MLAERLGLDVEDAFELLRYAARSARMKVHDLAALVVRERRTPSPIVAAIARTERWRAAVTRGRRDTAGAWLPDLDADVAAQVRRASKP